MKTTDDPLESLMARMAAGEFAALWTFHELFVGRLRSVVLRNVRSMGRHDVAADADRIDSLATDAAVLIFRRAGGWQPGGAKPWTWAELAIRSMIAADIGHRLVELGSDDACEGEVSGAEVGIADLTLEGCMSLHPSFELFAEAFRAVSSDRDQLAAWLFRTQKVNGDPSPARTVAHMHGITPANARQIHTRHFARVRQLVWADERFEPLRSWEWFAA